MIVASVHIFSKRKLDMTEVREGMCRYNDWNINEK